MRTWTGGEYAASNAGAEVKIEPASWRDLNALRELEKVCFPKDAWPLFDLIGVLSFPNLVRFKASLDGRMAGFIAAEHRPGDLAAWIVTVAVHPQARRRGIGRLLMEAAESRLTAGMIRLCVRASNHEAQRMYQALDYDVYETWSHYYIDGEDALVMQKVNPNAA